jgi:cell wall-associated NlpC family hydrolase
MWTDNYIGIPFKKNGGDRSGIDCWRLAVMIYKEHLGINLPSYEGIFLDRSMIPSESLASLRTIIRTMREEQKKWKKVKTPQPYDLVLIRVGGFHVGIAIDHKRMVHVMDGINVVIEEFTGRQWKDRIEGFWRYAR